MKVFVQFEGYIEGNYVDGYITGVSRKRHRKSDFEFELEEKK